VIEIMYAPRRVIFGLGNFGEKYVNTRHNVGALCVDSFREWCQGPAFEAEGDMMVSKWISENESAVYPRVEIMAIKPKTYINLSGKALAQFKRKNNLRFKNSPHAVNKMDELVVLCDQIHLNLPEIETKHGSSAKGHNGVAGIMKELKFKNFIRIEIGINDVYLGKPQSEYVLEPFTTNERSEFPELFQNINDILFRHVHGEVCPLIKSQYVRTHLG